MFSIHRPRRLVTLTLLAGVLAVAGPAAASGATLHAGAAGIVTDNKDPDTLVVHRADAHVFSGDAYDNEMGVTGRSADGIIAILIG